jgi:membrane-associated phospholipid phosphatase
MSANFEGNAGNEGNEGNAGNAGNATSASGGWFFADRIDLPFVTELDSTNAPIKNQRILIGQFPPRNWAADWHAWVALTQFVTNLGTVPPNQPAWQTINLPLPWPGFPGNLNSVQAQQVIGQELDDLVTAAQDERADALSEILSQADEFISYFMNLMTTRPTAYPATLRVLNIASLVALFVSMHYKGLYRRPRPSELCPALLPPIVVPGHASFPSGHATQARLMARCMGDVLNGLPQRAAMVDDLKTLARRIRRNREIAGVHYESDSIAGKTLADHILPLLRGLPANSWYRAAVNAAHAEWDPNNAANQYP